MSESSQRNDRSSMHDSIVVELVDLFLHFVLHNESRGFRTNREQIFILAILPTEISCGSKTLFSSKDS